MAVKVVGNIYELISAIGYGSSHERRYLCDSKEAVQDMIARLMDLPADSEEVVNAANGNNDCYIIKEQKLYECTSDDDPERVDIRR